MPQRPKLPILTEEQKHHLADLATEGRRAIARAPREAYEYHQIHPERPAATVWTEWERGVYLIQLQQLLLAIETALGLPAQDLPTELFGPPILAIDHP